jgi:hypothetical protein
MQLPPDIGIQQRLQKWSNYLATSVIIIALLSLIGWQWNIALLRDPFSSVVIMNPVSAIGFILSVLSMRLFARNSSGYTAYVLSILVLLIGVLTFISHIFGFSFQIDTLLFTHDIVSDGTADPGRRMTANTASMFCTNRMLPGFFSREKQKTNPFSIGCCTGRPVKPALISWLFVPGSKFLWSAELCDNASLNDNLLFIICLERPFC